MRILFYITSMLMVFLISNCADYSDHKIVILETHSQNILDSTIVNVGITGKEKLPYMVEIQYKGECVLNTKLTSNLSKTTTPLKLDFSLLKTRLVDLSHDIIRNQNVNIEILATNEEKRIFIDTTLTIQFYKPPIAVVYKIFIDKGQSTSESSTQLHLNNVRKRYNTLDNDISYKIAFLAALISSK